MRTPLKQTLRTLGRDVGNRARLLLVAKAAVAASLAWYLAPLVPFTADKYSYYAPLGVVISMYPTLARSAFSGIQSVIGLVIGIAVGVGMGLGIITLGGPEVVAVGLVVTVGMLLAGLRVLGAGRDWITFPALLVMLIGAGSPESFSLSYLIDMAFGVVVGVGVNFLVFPPVYVRSAGVQLSVLRDMVGDRLHDMSVALADGERDDGRLDAAMDKLVATAATVRQEVLEAAESRKGNPRSRRHGAQDQENYRRLRALERTVFFVRDLADVLGALGSDDSPDAIGGQGRADLAAAMQHAADLVMTSAQAEGGRQRLETADAAIETLLASFDERSAGRPSAVANNVTATVCLRRIVDASRPFVE